MIYYIYKVRRKQTSIHFSRSALPHRYLRYISWISWVRRPVAATSWVFPPHAAVARATFSRRCLYPKAAIAAALSLTSTWRTKQTSLQSFPRKNIFLPFFAHLCVSLLLCRSIREPTRAAGDLSAAGPPLASAALP